VASGFRDDASHAVVKALEGDARTDLGVRIA